MNNSRTWSLNLCRVSGIPIRVHVTFFLLLAWVAFEATGVGQDPLLEVFFVLALFGCVLLHEIAHALSALYFGLKTHDIVLYPFGGVSNTSGEASPQKSLAITLAGPAVNLVIALILSPFATVTIWPPSFLSRSLYEFVSLDFVTHLCIANWALFLFNLLPTFPMDGARILQALLQISGVRHAPKISGRISQGVGIAAALVSAWLWNPLIVVIAGFLFVNAMRDHMRERLVQTAHSFKVGDAMTPLDKLVIFQHGTTVSEALRLGLPTAQLAFPVMFHDQLLGILDRQVLIEVAASAPNESYISELTPRESDPLGPEAALTEVAEALHTGQQTFWPVFQGDKFLGILAREVVLEFLLVQGLREHVRQLPPEEFDSDEFM